MHWHVQLRFNSRLKGHGQVWAGTVEADCVQEAIDQASSAAVRMPGQGQSIYIVGVSAHEVRP
jgi:hypothetical protein